ncbi:MAG: hypothetical protein MUF54_00185 [Polyangiaceae bacterium]|jgi:hypothetical protein|nr:hypothetical protein [Polyangiaceae bacterium]
MQNHPAALANLALIVAVACQAPPREEPVRSAPERVVAAAASTQAAAAAHAQHQGCGEDHTAAEDKARTAKDPETGETLTHVGNDLHDAQKVSVSELLARPETFAGKTVRVEGNVTAMCHHKRGWFAIQDHGERTGKFVRVITTPRFLVPAGSIGKKARAEGTVEVIEESAGAAQHYAEGHKLGDPNQVKGPVKRVVLRANGAAFL